MNEPKWLTKEVALAVHSMLLAEHGGGTGIRDESLLESALARPQQKFTYEKESSICELAAALSHGLARNHPFVDGNKRVALTLGAVFLEINGLVLNAQEAEAVLTFEGLAAGTVSEQELSDWFEAHS